MPLNPEQPDAEEVQKQEQEKIDTAEPLSEEQLEEREKLLQEVCIYMSCTCVEHSFVNSVKAFCCTISRDLFF